MKKKTKQKTITLVKYSCAWLATIGVGFACWLIILMFDTTGYLLSKQVSFWFGFLGGILGTLCYFMAWSLLTPIVQWIWSRIKRKPQGFIKLVIGNKSW